MEECITVRKGWLELIETIIYPCEICDRDLNPFKDKLYRLENDNKCVCERCYKTHMDVSQ